MNKTTIIGLTILTIIIFLSTSYLFTVGVAWLLIYILGLLEITINGSVWLWGWLLWIVLLITNKFNK